MDIFLRLSKKFPISDIFRAGPYNRFESKPLFKTSYRVYFDDQKKESSRHSRKNENLRALIETEFSKALIDIGFESRGYAFVVSSSFSDSDLLFEDFLPAVDVSAEFERTSFYFDEMHFTVWGFAATKEIIYDVFNLFINRYLSLDSDDYIMGDFFVADESLSAIVNVYDDRGLDVIIHD